MDDIVLIVYTLDASSAQDGRVTVNGQPIRRAIVLRCQMLYLARRSFLTLLPLEASAEVAAAADDDAAVAGCS